jgi:hypothetical protein
MTYPCSRYPRKLLFRVQPIQRNDLSMFELSKEMTYLCSRYPRRWLICVRDNKVRLYLVLFSLKSLVFRRKHI